MLQIGAGVKVVLTLPAKQEGIYYDNQKRSGFHRHNGGAHEGVLWSTDITREEEFSHYRTAAASGIYKNLVRIKRPRLIPI